MCERDLGVEGKEKEGACPIEKVEIANGWIIQCGVLWNGNISDTIERILDSNAPALVIALGCGQTLVKFSLVDRAGRLVSVAQPSLAGAGNIPVQLPCTIVAARASTTILILDRGQGKGQADAILVVVVGNHNSSSSLDAHAFITSRNDGRKGDGGEKLGEEHGLIAINEKELSVNIYSVVKGACCVQDENIPVDLW